MLVRFETPLVAKVLLSEELESPVLQKMSSKSFCGLMLKQLLLLVGLALGKLGAGT